MAKEQEVDGLVFPEDSERSWRSYMNDFVDGVYPLFQQHGFTIPEAFTVWQLNRINNNITDLENTIKEKYNL
jgi:hypothetical protein